MSNPAKVVLGRVLIKIANGYSDLIKVRFGPLFGLNPRPQGDFSSGSDTYAEVDTLIRLVPLRDENASPLLRQHRQQRQEQRRYSSERWLRAARE